jgi:hypothetical protein
MYTVKHGRNAQTAKQAGMPDAILELELSK